MTPTASDVEPDNAPGGYRVAVELDVPSRMRDGTILRANVYRPEGAGPWPTLLTRTPYGKDLIDPLQRLDPIQAARRGFLVVIQDTRGRFASDGAWEPFRFERQDGHDTVEWAARLPGSNGSVGMFGESYVGNTQWLAAIEQPPSLGAISPALTWSEPMEGLLARGGARELGIGLSWSLSQNVDYVQRLPLAEAERERRTWAIVDEFEQLAAAGAWELPVGDDAVLRRHGVSGVGLPLVAREPERAAWCRVDGAHERVTVPTLHTAGWHDIFLQGTLDSYAAMTALGREARLVVGPWTHVDFADPIGDQRFGFRASRYGAPVHPHGDVNDLQLAWLRRQLVAGSDEPLPEAPVRVFVMGRNTWRDESCWPPARARAEAWFLHADGSLGAGPPPPDAGRTEFDYDPADPVPTCGGSILVSPAFPAGPLEQSRVEARADVCTFTSEPLQHDLELAGRVRVVLHAESSAPSTDWVARLCDVHPDGRSFHVCDGILRVARDAQACARREIDLWSTCNVFLRGHRLRIQVTSSCFPRWDRNLNTGDQRQARHEVARQVVFHDGDRPSFVELPVVEAR